MKRPAIVVNEAGPVHFPVMAVPFNIGKPASVAAFEEAAAAPGQELVLLEERCEIGSLFEILKAARLPDGNVMSHIRGIARVRVVSRSQGSDGRWYAEVEPVATTEAGPLADELSRWVIRAILADHQVPNEATFLFEHDGVPGAVKVDLAGYNAPDLDRQVKLQMLAELDVEARAKLVLSYWKARVEMLEAMATDFPPVPPPPAPEDAFVPPPSDPAASLSWLLTLHCRSGRIPADALEEVIEHDLGDWIAEDPARPAQVKVAIDAAVAAQKAREATFSGSPLVDRFLVVLNMLPRQGILCSAGEWFTRQEAEAALHRQAETDPTVKGWVFFTRQDEERAVQGQGVMMGFRGVRGTSDAEVAQLLVRLLTGVGVPTWWPEDPETRILVPIRWERRMP